MPGLLLQVGMSPTEDHRLPRYASIRDSLAARIAAKEWAPDSVIPSEADLAREYRTSINTLRRATEQLVREGLLERRQGSGTFVRKPSFDASLFRWFHFTAADGTITVPESRILKRTKILATEHLALKLGVFVGHRSCIWCGYGFGPASPS
jgi:GntR family transcriptional regulator